MSLHACKIPVHEVLQEFEKVLPLLKEGRKYGVQISIKRGLAYALNQSEDPIAEEVLKHVTVLAN